MVEACGTLYLKEVLDWEERPGSQDNDRTREKLGVTMEDNVITCVHLTMKLYNF